MSVPSFLSPPSPGKPFGFTKDFGSLLRPGPSPRDLCIHVDRVSCTSSWDTWWLKQPFSLLLLLLDPYSKSCCFLEAFHLKRKISLGFSVPQFFLLFPFSIIFPSLRHITLVFIQVRYHGVSHSQFSKPFALLPTGFAKLLITLD